METATVYYQVYVGGSTMPEASFLRHDAAQIWVNNSYSHKVEKKIVRTYVDNTKDNLNHRARMREAAALLRDMIDGGEECSGRDGQLTEVINLLEYV